MENSKNYNKCSEKMLISLKDTKFYRKVFKRDYFSGNGGTLKKGSNNKLANDEIVISQEAFSPLSFALLSALCRVMTVTQCTDVVVLYDWVVCCFGSVFIK